MLSSARPNAPSERRVSRPPYVGWLGLTDANSFAWKSTFLAAQASVQLFSFGLEAIELCFDRLTNRDTRHGVREAKYAAIETMSSTVKLATVAFMSCAATPARDPVWMS